MLIRLCKNIFHEKTASFFEIFIFRPWIIEKGHKTPISQFCINQLNFDSFLNFVLLFSSPENETEMSEDSI